MSRIYTYSFEDTYLIFSHPGFGTYKAYGTGIGKVTVTMNQEISSQDVAADLSVIVSKHAYKHGKVSLEVLQSSDFNSWLKKFVSFLEVSNTDQWALASIVLKNNSTGDNYSITGVSPEKIPDNSFEATASKREWSFLAANIINKQ